MLGRRGGYGGRSKANPNTTCQKCLQKGHYSYECTVSAQERPYKARPSRTQQLLNPSLKPKLSEDIPNDLLPKKGLADKILAEKEEERRRKAGIRSRSASSASDSDSVSTISTSRSRSPSPPPKRIDNGHASVRVGARLGKRGRRSVSYESDHSLGRAERNTRRRLSSMSPEQRGRRRSRSRSRSSHMDISHDEGARRRASRKHYSPSRSYTGGTGRRSRSRSRKAYGRPVRRLSLSKSPSRSPNRMDISDDRHLPQTGNSHADPDIRDRWGPPSTSRRLRSSRSRSPYRRSPSPYSKRRISRSPSPYKSRNGGMNGSSHGGGRHPLDDAEPVRTPAQPPAPPRERSLSPYSKRVALTRQMQGGR